MSNIREDIEKTINEFKEAIETAAYASRTYVTQYKIYCSHKMHDSDLLKERMKNVIAENVNSDDEISSIGFQEGDES